MTVPAVPVAAIGGPLSASWWNNSAAPPVSFLLDPPKCDVYCSAATSCPSGTAVLLGMDTELVDTDTMHATGTTGTGSTSNSRVTFTTPGRYLLNLGVVFVSGTTLTTFSPNLRLNAAGSASGGSSIRTWPNANAARQFAVSFFYVFNAGDYVELFVTQANAGATAVTLDTGGGRLGNYIQAKWESIT